MLFRIEDTENLAGCHRQYELIEENLPCMTLSEIDSYIANEVRKEINNAAERKLLSYSKSLGVCLLKYNEYTDNTIHISPITQNCLWYYDCKKTRNKIINYDIYYGLPQHESNHPNRKIILQNYSLDVSDNNQLDWYLRCYTGKGRKKLASPEKDHEVVLMQSPDDWIITEYTSSIYLLYALFHRYGMSQQMFCELYDEIMNLEPFRFNYCNESEKEGILLIIKYLFYSGTYEKDFCKKVFDDSKKESRTPFYYDPILQLHDIQEDDFADSYMLGDYNGNVVSDLIWDIYYRHINNEI